MPTVLSFCICLTRITDQLLEHLFATLLLQSFFTHLLRNTKIRTFYLHGPGNHRYFGTQLLLKRAETSSVLRGFSYFSGMRVL